MAKLNFDLDFDVTLFTGEGNFKVDKDGNPWDITYLVHGDVKRYENVSVSKTCSARIIRDLGNSFLFDLIKREVWYSIFSNYLPCRKLYAYKAPVSCSRLAVYHEMNRAGFPSQPIWLLRYQSKQVLAGVYGHRLKSNSPVRSCSNQVCVSVGDYLVNSDDDKIETFVFSGPIDKMTRVADFLNCLGTPSLRFLADPVVLIPSGSPKSVFDREVERMSKMMEWVSAGEYWTGGAVVRHSEGSCRCPLCFPESVF
jgi:hypothetical protein